MKLWKKDHDPQDVDLLYRKLDYLSQVVIK